MSDLHIDYFRDPITGGIVYDGSGHPLTVHSPVPQKDAPTLRQIIREELQRQEGFLRAMVQEELEAQHDAYEDVEEAPVDYHRKYRVLQLPSEFRPSVTAELEHEGKTYRGVLYLVDEA